jgi:hypothetical protein
MKVNVQQAQRCRALDRKIPPLRLGSVSKTARSSTARLENPLGVLGGRSVEALSRAREGQHRHAAARLGLSEARKLAKGAQENDLQHRCACSARSPSPYGDNGDGHR